MHRLGVALIAALSLASGTVVAVAVGASAAWGAKYHANPATQRAIELLSSRQYEAALKQANLAVQETPRDSLALATRGNIVVELGDYRAALADHDQVLAMVPTDTGALNNACWVRALLNSNWTKPWSTATAP